MNNDYKVKAPFDLTKPFVMPGEEGALKVLDDIERATANRAKGNAALTGAEVTQMPVQAEQQPVEDHPNVA